MNLQGKICFRVFDSNKEIKDIGFKLGFNPSKLIIKDTPVTSKVLSSKNIWVYNVKFMDAEEFDSALSDFITLLNLKKKIIDELKKVYEGITITIYIRSDYGQIGFTVNKQFIHELSKLDIDLSIDILSFGMVESD